MVRDSRYDERNAPGHVIVDNGLEMDQAGKGSVDSGEIKDEMVFASSTDGKRGGGLMV
jgi:hypothetical protein